jgi:flagellin
VQGGALRSTIADRDRHAALEAGAARAEKVFEAGKEPTSLTTEGITMGLTVNTNMASINASTNLQKSSRNLQGSFERISSGMRITRASDDAAGYGVAENLSAASKSLSQAMRNTSDGISVVRTAQGAAGEVGNILKRMRELAVQSSSETLNDDERLYIQDENAALIEEIGRIASTTEFNGTQLADGSLATLDVQVGINDTANDRITITLGDLTATTLGVDTLDLSTSAAAQPAITTIDAALDLVNQVQSDYGAAENRLDSAQRNLEVYAENVSSAESSIRDADFARETAEMSKNQVMQQAGVAVLAQANQVSQGALRLLG